MSKSLGIKYQGIKTTTVVVIIIIIITLKADDWRMCIFSYTSMFLTPMTLT